MTKKQLRCLRTKPRTSSAMLLPRTNDSSPLVLLPMGVMYCDCSHYTINYSIYLNRSHTLNSSRSWSSAKEIVAALEQQPHACANTIKWVWPRSPITAVIVLLLCNQYFCYSLGQILYYYQLITHFDPCTIRAATVTAERLSVRHLILLHCRTAFVCMYVCIYVQRRTLVRCGTGCYPIKYIHTGFCSFCCQAPQREASNSAALSDSVCMYVCMHLCPVTRAGTVQYGLLPH